MADKKDFTLDKSQSIDVYTLGLMLYVENLEHRNEGLERQLKETKDLFSEKGDATTIRTQFVELERIMTAYKNNTSSLNWTIEAHPDLNDLLKEVRDYSISDNLTSRLDRMIRSIEGIINHSRKNKEVYGSMKKDLPTLSSYVTEPM